MRWNESEQVNLSLKDCLNSTFESRIRWCMIKPQILQSGRHYWSKITLTSQRGEVLWNLPCKRKKRGGGEGEIKLKKSTPSKTLFCSPSTNLYDLLLTRELTKINKLKWCFDKFQCWWTDFRITNPASPRSSTTADSWEVNHSFLLVFVYFIECYTGNNQHRFPQVIPQNARLNVLSHFNKIKFHRKENIPLAKLNHFDHMLPSDEPNQSWATEIYCMKSCHSECIQNLPPFPGSRQGCLLHTLWVPPQRADGYDGYTSFRINKGDYLSLEPRSWTHSILYPEDGHMQAARVQYQMEYTQRSFKALQRRSRKTWKAARAAPGAEDLRQWGEKAKEHF